MNARDEMAEDMRALGITVVSGPAVDLTEPLAQHLIKAGWVKPRTITTVEELAELDSGTIIRAVKSEHNPHGLCFEKYGKEWLALDPADREDGEVTIPHTAVLRFHGAHSITVLFTPDEGQA